MKPHDATYEPLPWWIGIALGALMGALATIAMFTLATCRDARSSAAYPEPRSPFYGRLASPASISYGFGLTGVVELGARSSTCIYHAWFLRVGDRAIYAPPIPCSSAAQLDDQAP